MLTLFKKSIKFPIIYFAVSIVWQLVVYREVSWVDSIGICLLTFLILFFYHWTNVPYNWKKGHNE
ncbi:hypothetical protein [Mesobacillus persicus]|uniref:hypothetical protein n=1 Tax=Mesobacillus persicus TaxID=930146 RepID=UPI000B88BFFA|nr:hypothetical protein [Mesobacillus persicus]